MIHEVDESLRLLMRSEALQGADIDILFETPTKEWASRRNTPTIDVFLYDIREDVGRREEGVIDIRGEDGKVVDRRRPPRYYKLSYLVTAWTQRPEDEHRLLSACMAAFLKHGELPKSLLVGSLEELGLTIMVNIALPPPQDRSISDIWTALGGELKPSLELVVVAPLETHFPIHVGPALTEPPIFGMRKAEGSVVERNRPRIPGVPARRNGHAGGGGADGAEAVPAGKVKQVKGPAGASTGAGAGTGPGAGGGAGSSASGAPAAAARGKKRGKALAAATEVAEVAPDDSTMPEAWDEVDEHVVAEPLPEEAIVMGEDGTGRVFRIQGMPRKRT